MPMLFCALQSKISLTHHPCNERGYVDGHSWAAYLYRHPGYTSYQPIPAIKKYGCHWGSWITFPQKIEAIQTRVGRMSDPRALFRSKDFLVMYKHPDYYQQAFLNYLVDKRYTLEQKKIAIYATVRLNPWVSWDTYYQLYKKKDIDLPLLELLLAIGLSHRFGGPSEAFPDIRPALKLSKEECSRLAYIKNNLPKDTSLYSHIKAILDHRFPKSWYRYRILSNCDPANDYYVAHFPFYDILTDAVRDADYAIEACGEPPFGLASYPYFLMVMEHPQDYYPAHFELGTSREQGKPKRRGDGIDVLRYKAYTDKEKSMAIFGMSQLGVSSSHESSDYYAFIIEHAIEWYKQGNLSVHHLLQLFICTFPTFYKYPFFILDYKAHAIQAALNKFIAEPTIPEGVKDIARKVQNGTLATKEEMNYMEGYRAFRKTYFTLYETVIPHG